MRLITKQLPNNHNLFFFSCKHEGAALSSNKGWNIMVDMMHSKYDECYNNYGVDLGDAIEAIMVDDKRSDEQKLSEPFVLTQIEMAVERREPIKDILLEMLTGNHERKLWRFGDITASIVRALNKKGANISYGTYTSKITIQDTKGNQMYKNYVTHGFKTIRSVADDPIRRIANEELQLKRHLKFKAGDCAVMVKAHAHKLRVCKPLSELYLTDDGKKIQQHYTSCGQNEDYIHPDARWYGCAGSFLRLFGQNISGYAEVMEFDPVEIGFLVLRVRNKKIISLDPVYLPL